MDWRDNRYHVRCAECGTLNGIYPTRENAMARVSRHLEIPSQRDHQVIITEAKTVRRRGE